MVKRRKSAMLPVYLAVQVPRIDLYNPGNTDKAELLFELLDEYGTKLLEWQRHVLRRWLAEDEQGNYANLQCGLSVPRQNGKTEIIVDRIIYGIIFKKEIGLFTAQQKKTADVVKRRVQDFFYENQYEEIFNLLAPKFRKKPRDLDYIEFENGARYDFATRTRMGGLGETNDALICDEAADMTDDHESTLIPTTSAAKSGNPQIIYCGTPPMATTVGEVFGRFRKKMLSGASGAWTEWSVERLTDVNDREAWFKTNPSLGEFLLVKAVENEAGTMSADNFNRMRLGWWSGIEDKRAIQQKEWDVLFTEKPEFDDSFEPVYAVKFSPDRSEYSLVVAQPLKDSNKIHVEIVMQRPMSEGWAKLSKWLIDRWQRCAKIIIDGATGQAILFEELTRSGVPQQKIVQPTMKEIVAAHQFFYDGIEQKEVSHYNQPLLNQTVRIAKMRQIGRYGGFGWESMSKEQNVSALDAATFAYWGQKVFSSKVISKAEIEANNQKWHDIFSNL